MSCGRVRDWLHRDVETLDDAARLLLDDHLATCARCLDDREQLRRVRHLGESLAVPAPSDRAINRAIARALLEGSARRVAPVRTARVWIPLAAFAALCAAAVIGYVAFRGRDSGARDAHATAPSEPKTPPEQAPEIVADIRDVVDEGVVYAGSTTLTAGDAVPADTQLHTDARARVRLGSARVAIAAATELRWLPAEHTILLERGGLEIDPSTPAVARVLAAHFTAELHDAAVAVAPSAVRVQRGQVTIIAPSSEEVVARLEAGDVWTLPEPEPTPPPRTRSTAKAPTVAELMKTARRQFAARQYAEAARSTEAALALSPRRADEAEARIFLGDIAQATGDLALAAKRYTAVADGFVGEPAAESALYAAARIELRRGRTAVARTLLGKYLDRHPAGRFADDVRRELDALPRSQP